MTLEQAIAMAEGTSERLTIARAGVDRSSAEEVRARADLFPQLSGSASYDRTLATEFSSLFSQPSAPACAPFSAQPDAPLSERVAEIERAIDCGAVGGNLFGGDNLDLPFGRKNAYRFGFLFSQALFTGGRITAQRSAAAAGRQLAGIVLDSTRAQVVLDVTQSYYDAALSDHLLGIAEAGLKQASDTLALVELSRKAGRLPEFELLRARVTRDNQTPVVLRARSQRTLAYLRLRLLLHLRDGAPLQVVANLDDQQLPPPGVFAEALARSESRRAQLNENERTAVRQALASVEARQAAAKIARSQRWPSLSANSSYGRVAYAGMPSWGDFRTNWTVGIAAQVPLFTGGRIRADEMAARADLDDARAQLALTKNLAQADTLAAFEELDAARATWEASSGTVEQAVRAYEIAELRYREGISTQLELSDARYLLEQSQANRAQAGRDLQVARARVALLPDLPFSATSPVLSAGATGAYSPTTVGQAAAALSPSAGSAAAGAAQRAPAAAPAGSATQAGPGGIRQ